MCRYRAARAARQKVVICERLKQWPRLGLWWVLVGCDVVVVVVVVGGPRCDFCPNPAGQWKASPATRVFWKAAGLRNTPRKISHKQRKLPASSAESMRHFVELCICLIPPQKCYFGQKSGLMVGCLNLEIRWYVRMERPVHFHPSNSCRFHSFVSKFYWIKMHKISIRLIQISR